METQPDKETWKAYPLDEYRNVAAALVHFSTKGVNSNAEAGGVRLGPEAGLHLPYVSARCLLARGVDLAADYTKNAGNTATVVKQIRLLAGGGHGETPETAQAIQAAVAKAMAGAYQTGTESVSPRLRQLLLPKGEGEYLAITPLPAGGLSAVVNERAKAHNESVDEAAKQAKGDEAAAVPRRLRLATLGVGGANPQNVGALVREMQTALVFDAPIENRALREAYRIHYQGIPLRLPYRAMLAWRQWRDRAAILNDGGLPTGLEAREEERALLLAVAKAVLHSGTEALRLLQKHQEELPGGELLSSELEDSVARGLVDPAERGNDWAKAFGERLAGEIGRYAPDAQGVLVALNSEALAAMAGWFEEATR